MEPLDITFDVADASELMDISAIDLSSSFSLMPDLDDVLQNLSMRAYRKPTMRSKSVLSICTPTTLVIVDKKRTNVTDKILDVNLGNDSLRPTCARKPKYRKLFNTSQCVQLKNRVTKLSPSVIRKISKSICTTKDLENVEEQLHASSRKTPKIDEISKMLGAIKCKRDKVATANMILNVLFSEPWQDTFNTQSIWGLQINDRILCSDSNTGIPVYYEAKIIDIDYLDQIGRSYWVHYVGWRSKWDVAISVDDALQRFLPFSEENKSRARDTRKIAEMVADVQKKCKRE
ncbi:hypothetical protein DdX_06682 [Ditylenchus destructor]|uniref:MSL3 chromodomain-like domain-containing protein n=1 Tax=Ditylenchus destructor TaxID=166010 RepID=A0AAD4N7K3_9BILA|nr:hypothetical protein DdX_06682 [Ditylenchus destructor]